MIRLAANLSFLFTELPFLERFEAAAAAGFRAVELAFPYDIPRLEIAARLHASGLKIALLNTPLGDAAGGEMGVAALPGREKEVEAGVRRALEYAEVLDAPRIHMLAGVVPLDADRQALDQIFLRNIVRGADLAAAAGREITLEPLNGYDRPGYFLQSCTHARRLIKAAGRDNVRLQLDVYHCRFQEDDLVSVIDREIELLGHVQIANFPDRREPTVEGCDYQRVLAHLEAKGFEGYVGCEYVPAKDTTSGLRWAEAYLSR
jgi:2-dehydrotetronate isomerase